MNKIKCTECGYENEPERVYCHKCGVKLDRSLLPKEPDKPDPGKVRKQVKRLTQPNSGFFVGFWKKLFATLLWAVIVAALIQIVRPPKDVPEMPDANSVTAAQPISLILEDAILKGNGTPIHLKAKDINDYLFENLHSKGAGALNDYVKFARAFVVPRDGALAITVQNSVFEFPIYATTFYSLQIKEDGSGLEAENLGGQFGRLPVHPLLMPYLNLPTKNLWNAMKREKRLMDQLASVEVTKDGIVLTPSTEPTEE